MIERTNKAKNMTSKEALEELFKNIEFLTSVDYVPIDVREGARRALIEKFWDCANYYDNIKKDLETRVN